MAAVIVALGLQQAMHIQIGETEAGSPLLWPNSHFNISTRNINANFAGANQFVIYLEGGRSNVLKEPAVLETLESFRRYMLEQPEAGGTRDLPTLVQLRQPPVSLQRSQVAGDSSGRRRAWET